MKFKTWTLWTTSEDVRVCNVARQRFGDYRIYRITVERQLVSLFKTKTWQAIRARLSYHRKIIRGELRQPVIREYKSNARLAEEGRDKRIRAVAKSRRLFLINR